MRSKIRKKKSLFFSRGLICCLFAVSICGCGSAQTADATSPKSGQTAEKGARQQESGEQLRVDAQDAWSKRNDRVYLERAIALWRRVLVINASDTETWMKLSQAYFFRAQSLCENGPSDSTNHHAAQKENPDSSLSAPALSTPELNEASSSMEMSGCESAINLDGQETSLNAVLETLQQGKQAAENALSIISPSILEQLKDEKSFPQAISSLEVNVVPALYWWSVHLSEWSRLKGYAEQIVYKDRLLAAMAFCLEKDHSYDNAGAHRFFGALFARPLSEADKSIKESKRHFERALEIAPQFLANRYLFARAYAVTAQDRRTFETQLKFIIEANPNADPSIAPENRIYQRKAERLLQQAHDLFE
jgi:hypothetical protein